MKKLLNLSLILFAFLSLVSCSDDDNTSEASNGKKTLKIEIEPLVTNTSDITSIQVFLQIPSTDSELIITGTHEIEANNLIDFKQYEIEFTDVENTITIETAEKVEKPIGFLTAVNMVESFEIDEYIDVANLKAYTDNRLIYESSVKLFEATDTAIIEPELDNW